MFISLPCDNVWTLNKFLLPFATPDCINGVEAYEYLSGIPANPLYCKVSPCVTNWIITPSINEPESFVRLPASIIPWLINCDPDVSASNVFILFLNSNSAYPGVPAYALTAVLLLFGESLNNLTQ